MRADEVKSNSTGYTPPLFKRKTKRLWLMRFYAVSAFVFPLVLSESPAIRGRASYRRPSLPMRLMAQRLAAARRKMRFSAARY